MFIWSILFVSVFRACPNNGVGTAPFYQLKHWPKSPGMTEMALADGETRGPAHWRDGGLSHWVVFPSVFRIFHLLSGSSHFFHFFPPLPDPGARCTTDPSLLCPPGCSRRGREIVGLGCAKSGVLAPLLGFEDSGSMCPKVEGPLVPHELWRCSKIRSDTAQSKKVSWKHLKTGNWSPAVSYIDAYRRCLGPQRADSSRVRLMWSHSEVLHLMTFC